MGDKDQTSGPDEGPVYDARHGPRRGVRIDPLPIGHHREFRRLIDQLRVHAQSQKSTWALADRTMDLDYVRAEKKRWNDILTYLNTVEYQGTRNANPSSNPHRVRHRSRSD